MKITFFKQFHLFVDSFLEKNSLVVEILNNSLIKKVQIKFGLFSEVCGMFQEIKSHFGSFWKNNQKNKWRK